MPDAEIVNVNQEVEGTSAHFDNDVKASCNLWVGADKADETAMPELIDGIKVDADLIDDL